MVYACALVCVGGYFYESECPFPDIDLISNYPEHLLRMFFAKKAESQKVLIPLPLSLYILSNISY